MTLTIYSKLGIEKLKISDFKYNGSFMSDRAVSTMVYSPISISFMPDDYLDFRNERFVLDYIPAEKKTASSQSRGDAFIYDLNFTSIGRAELERCNFKDVVLGDSNVHYTGMTKVEFTGDVYMLADRIQANLNGLYANAWTVSVQAGTVRKVENVSISDGSCLDAIVLVQSLYDLNFTIIGRVITIGSMGVTHSHVFEYGKGKGLYSIDRNTVTEDAIVTRLRCYGSTENIPSNYKKGVGSIVSTAQYIPSLMLPNYETTLIDYIDSSIENKAIYGIREGIFRDESIFPSIETMTGEQIRAAGGSSSSTGRVDVIVSATPILTDAQPDFKINILDIGFNINDYLGEKAMVEFTDGKLGGVQAEITNVKAITGGYQLTLNRNTDSTFPLPDQNTFCTGGDHFVITGIKMPAIYVKAAEQRLLIAGQAYLAEYDHSKSTYSIGLDEIFMLSDASGSTVMEGDLFHVLDADLGIDAPILIQQLSITYGGVLPKYEVTLSDKPIATTLDRVQQDITKIETVTGIINNAAERQARRNVTGLNRLKDYAFDPVTGKLNPTVIAAGSIETQYLAVGTKISNFVLLSNIKTNYNG